MRPDFLIIPIQLYDRTSFEPIDRDVYAVVYWFQHLKDGRCTASNNAIARVINCSPRSVQNSLTKLEEYGAVERFYTDNTKRHRKEVSCKISFRHVRTGGDTKKHYAPVVIDDSTGGDTAYAPVVTRESKKRVIEESNNTAPHDGAGLNKLIDLFKEVNPSFERLFSNTTQRKALKRLVDKHGLEKVSKSIMYAVSVSGANFAPTITTPVQLENKLGDLVAYFKKQSKKGPKLIEV